MGLDPGKTLAPPPSATACGGSWECREGAGRGAEEIPFYFEKIAVFDYPIIPNYKAGTTMDFP